MNQGNERPDEQEEWQAQERGLRAARGDRATGRDPLAERYLLLSEALAAAPVAEPPADFAATVSARIAQQDAAMERTLTTLLVCALALSLVVVTGMYGDKVLQVLRVGLPEGSMAVMFSALACISLTWGIRFASVVVRRPGNAGAM